MEAGWERAIHQGDAVQVAALLAQGAQVNSRDRYGQTALMLAAQAGHREVVELLLARRPELDVTAKYGLNALMLAIVAGHQEIARRLAAAGADLALRGCGAPGFSGQTAHDLAVARGWLELATKLQPDEE